MLEDEDAEPITREQMKPWARAMFDLLDEHADHPVRARCDMLGTIGVDDGDHSLGGAILPFPTFRFMIGDAAAYVWRFQGQWGVSPWHERQVFEGRTFEEVDSFRGALDRLAALLPSDTSRSAPPRSWWQRLLVKLQG